MKKSTKLVIFVFFALISMFLFLSCHGKKVDKNIVPDGFWKRHWDVLSGGFEEVSK